jgi:hypothetical protein
VAAKFGEGGVSGSPLAPDLKQLLDTAPPKHCDVAERIVNNTVSELTGYGRKLRQEDLVSLAAVASTVEAMACGTAEPSLFLSTQPTGWGKTAILVASVQAIVSDPTLAHVGCLIMVNTLDQIKVLTDRMALSEHQYAVRVGEDRPDMNNWGLTGLCKTKRAKAIAHRYAQILFTTQQKISKALMPHQNDFDRMPFFDYCGRASPEEIEGSKNLNSCSRKRQVKLWDEAYLPIDPITIGSDQIRAFRGGPGCLNRFSASISGVSAGVRLPSGMAVG